MVIRRITEAEEFGYAAQLPLALTPGLDAPGQTVRFYAADIPERVDATLKLANSTSHDSMTVSLNGIPFSRSCAAGRPTRSSTTG